MKPEPPVTITFTAAPRTLQGVDRSFQTAGRGTRPALVDIASDVSRGGLCVLRQAALVERPVVERRAPVVLGDPVRVRQIVVRAHGDRLRRGERPDTRVAPGAGTPAVPLGAVRVRAVLDQEHALRLAERGDLVDLEGEVAADMDDEGGARLVLVQLPLEILEGH